MKKEDLQTKSLFEATGTQEGEKLESDMFDMSGLRLTQNSAILSVKKALLTVPVRKPRRQNFIRVRPRDDWRLETAVLENKEEGETSHLARSPPEA